MQSPVSCCNVLGLHLRSNGRPLKDFKENNDETVSVFHKISMASAHDQK